jgi:hypothetical protein
MKIDMSPSAVTLRLRQVNQLRRTCLALANCSVARRIRKKYAANQLVQRTSHALGRRPMPSASKESL